MVYQYNREYVPEGWECQNVLTVSDDFAYKNAPENFWVTTFFYGLDEKGERICDFTERSFSVKEIKENLAEGEFEAHGSITFEKPWDKPVYESMRYTFVTPTEDGSLRWIRNYRSDDLPLVAVSKQYPDIKFEYIERGECTEWGAEIYVHELIKNGKCID